MGAPESTQLLADAAEKSACDFTRKVEVPAYVAAPSAARDFLAGFSGRHRIKRTDEDYQVSFHGDWLTAAEAALWRDRLQAEEDAWNPAPGFGNSVCFQVDLVPASFVAPGPRTPAAPGDLVVHRVVEAKDVFSASYRAWYAPGIVLAADARGHVASLRDGSGVRHGAQDPHIIPAGEIDAEAVLRYYTLREAELGEYAEWIKPFCSPAKAARALAPFVRPQPAVPPSFPDRTLADPRVTRRFPPEPFEAEMRPDGRFGQVGRVVTRPVHPVRLVEIEEIDAPTQESWWAVQNRVGITAVRPTRAELDGLWRTLPLEIQRGYARVLPVSLRDLGPRPTRKLRQGNVSLA